MGNDDTTAGQATPSTLTARQMVSQLARRSGAGLNTRKPTPGAMCEQGQDWSHGNACIPQKLVQLVGHRDPNARTSYALPQRPITVAKKPVPSDTPIG